MSNAADTGLGHLLQSWYCKMFCSKKACPPSHLQSQRTIVVDSELAAQRQQQWFASVKKCDVDHMQELMDAGVNINSLDQDRWTALHLAAWNGLEEVVTALLKHPECDVNLTGPSGSTPLTLASQQGHLNIVTSLLTAKADVNIAAQMNNCHNVTSLHLAAQNGHKDIVVALISHGANVNVAMTNSGVAGVTPLHLAAEAGHTHIMDVLIDNGCKVDTPTVPNVETNC